MLSIKSCLRNALDMAVQIYTHTFGKAPEDWSTPRRFALAKYHCMRRASWSAAALRRFFRAPPLEFKLQLAGRAEPVEA